MPTASWARREMNGHWYVEKGQRRVKLENRGANYIAAATTEGHDAMFFREFFTK
jgi:hypothetical protein